MQRPTLRRIGLLILLGATVLYAVSTWWIKTRDYIPLEVPVDLAPGQSTHALEINLGGNYEFLLVRQKDPQFQGEMRCLLFACPGQPVDLHAKWTLEKGELEIARGSSDEQGDETNFGYYGVAKVIGSQRLSRGKYIFELNTFYSSDMLGLGQPTVVVVADGATYNAASRLHEFWLVLSCVLGATSVGIMLLPIRSADSAPLVPDFNARPKAAALAAPDRVTRFAVARRFGFPAYGLFAAIFFASMMMVMMVATGNNYLSYGLCVHLQNPATSVAQPRPYVEPIIVHVTITSRKHTAAEMKALPPRTSDYEITNHFILNHEDLTEAALKPKLRELLVTRADRTVYVQGDDDISYETVVSAIDAAKSSYSSRVVLLTKQDTVPSLHHR